MLFSHRFPSEKKPRCWNNVVFYGWPLAAWKKNKAKTKKTTRQHVICVCSPSVILRFSATNNSRGITSNPHCVEWTLWNLEGEIREVSKLFIPPPPSCPPPLPYSSLLSAALGLVVESSQLDRSIPDVPAMPCLERVSEWLVPVYPSSTPAYEMFSSKLTRCFSQLKRQYV